jgi:4-hydroxybenzoate polyprenyltransferase
MREIMDKSAIGMKHTLPFWFFVASVLAVTAVTAAGNIINDYFDQKVDRINKPDRVVVGKKVKRRVAIILHQGLNGFAILMSLLVCAA